MKLNVRERLWLLNLIISIKEGDALTLRIVRDLSRELSFTEKEIKDHNIRNEIVDEEKKTRATMWSKDFSKNIDMGPTAISIVKDIMGKLDQSKKIPLEFLDIYEKFMDIKNEQ